MIQPIYVCGTAYGVEPPDWYDTHCPTCDAPEPTHTPTCAVVHVRVPEPGGSDAR